MLPISSNNRINSKYLTAYIPINIIELEVLVMADIPPAGPTSRLNVKITLEIPIKRPAQNPISKLKAINVFVTFQ